MLDTPKVQLYPLCVGESVHPRLRRLDLDGVQLFCFQVPPRLEYFRYCNEVTPNIPGRDDGVDYLIRAPSVSTIILSNVPRADVFIKRLYCTETEIAARVIHLDDCLDVSGPSMQRLAEQSDKLNPVTDLSLSNASDVNDSNVSIITAKMADLMSVNLSHTEISGCTIKHLADSGRKIARICVKGCENVSSDAVAYGRAKGIEIIT